VVVCPVAGDMAENASRVDWAGVGVRLPCRYATPRGVRAAVGRVLRSPAIGERAGELARWAAAHDGAARAVDELEAWAHERAHAPRPA
jgi:UDP:flavonoid glycosyltransferase YjiC (YdhE family)